MNVNVKIHGKWLSIEAPSGHDIDIQPGKLSIRPTRRHARICIKCWYSLDDPNALFCEACAPAKK